MTKIFVSYRIVDSAYAVREISKRMAARIGRDNVFRDDDSLELGTQYARRIRKALEQSDLLVAVIGPQWLDVTDEHGNRRIDNDRDWVRVEMRTAYERDTPVIPVLLDDTSPPAVDQLPDDIETLGRSQFWRIRHRTMDADIGELLDRLIPGAPEVPPEATRHIQVNRADNNSNVVTNSGGTQHITIGGDHTGGL
ncbi:toll/interleukin-1 receptor domain-containing protein [Nocardia sp. SYP-A9097]|uniref:toll/interleukin-1 receptor domain-containing protein n=1 Tax=Nocardia sp. SYP-A9097 TaxID=2663237 RepID=UPI001890D2F2|nr:toll/interleukin-1 receptor domain-containing protein [Nocardia sp. SYP-A9097]